MGRKKAPKIRKNIVTEKFSGNFFMLTPEFLKDDDFKQLTHAEKYFYLCLCTNRESVEQKQCLYNTLKEYNECLQLGLTEQDITEEANMLTKYYKGYFVCPAKQLEEYGFKPNYATKLKKSLQKKGYIKIAYGGKGKYNGWNENVTIYQFIDDWRKKPLH